MGVSLDHLPRQHIAEQPRWRNEIVRLYSRLSGPGVLRHQRASSGRSILPQVKVELTANSALTFASSTADSQAKIGSVFGQLNERDPRTKALPGGRFITPAGDTRIVWTRQGDRIL